jgi:CheY-like chemotaxis protein
MIAAVAPDTARAKVLCVDDEPHVLEGLSVHLRRRYHVDVAGSGPAALRMLEADGDTAVIISDMRMPGMDGATFLKQCRKLRPDAVRVLLTGHADMASAIEAVNEGQIFRFLLKPCPSPALLGAVEAAVVQHRLVTSERVLLEQTLHGSIKALIDVLALANPVAFGRAIRIKQLVAETARTLDIAEPWQVEVAAMLAHIGAMSLPPETVERVYYGKDLSDAEREMVARVPAVTENLLAHIPRLETVRAILGAYTKPRRPPVPGASEARTAVSRSAALLCAATDFDVLVAQGLAPGQAIDVMRAREGRYDKAVLDAIAAVRAGNGEGDGVHEITLAGLRVGMVFAEDVKLTTGALLVTRGYEVTAGFVERARNFRNSVREPLRVTVRSLPGGSQ